MTFYENGLNGFDLLEIMSTVVVASFKRIPIQEVINSGERFKATWPSC